MPGRGVQDPQQAGPGHARAGGDSEGCQVAAAFPLFPRGELVLRGGMGRGTCGQFPEGSLLLEGAWPCGHGGELLPAPRHPSHSGSANGKLGEAQGLSLAETCGDAPPLVQSSVHRGCCWPEAQYFPRGHPFSLPLPPRPPPPGTQWAGPLRSGGPRHSGPRQHYELEEGE